MDLHTQLSEVVTQGPPAQAERARDLLRQLDASDEVPAELVDEIQLLYDAYLHDPYLTRNPRDLRSSRGQLPPQGG